MIGADKRTDDFSRWVTELINGSVALREGARENLRRLFFRQPSDKTALPGTDRPLQDVGIALCVSW